MFKYYGHMNFDETFPEGFLRDERNVVRTRQFFIDHLSVPPNSDNVEDAAGVAYLALSIPERERLQTDWVTFLATLE